MNKNLEKRNRLNGYCKGVTHEQLKTYDGILSSERIYLDGLFY